MKPKPDGWYARFFCAFSFLTRLHLPGGQNIDFTPAVLTGSIVFYPVVGLFYGLVTIGLGLLGTWLKLDATLSAFSILLAPYLINRFLHFDGLCDVLDGFLADRNPEQRLAIMKDSRNGSFAMGGAILLLLGKYLLILNLLEIDGLIVLALAPLFLRWLVITMAYGARYPRPTGTAFHLVGQVSGRKLAATTALLLISVALLAVASFGLGLWSISRPHLIVVVAALTFAALWTVWLRRVSTRKIGGVTGDVLGCLVESGETLAFLGAVLGLKIMTLAGIA